MKTKKPLLIATLGYPGSGKTYFSEQLAKDFNFFHINADRIRMEMFHNPVFTPAEHRAVFGFVDWLAKELLRKGISVIVDANTNRRAHRRKFHDMAEKAHAQFLLIYINTPLEAAEKRLIQGRSVTDPERKKYYQEIDPSVLHRMKKNIEYPVKGEKFLVISGLIPYREQAQEFKTWLAEGRRGKNRK